MFGIMTKSQNWVFRGIYGSLGGFPQEKAFTPRLRDKLAVYLNGLYDNKYCPQAANRLQMKSFNRHP